MLIFRKFLQKIRELFGIDYRSLALMRIGFALILLVDLFIRSKSLIAHYTDFGVLPRSAILIEMPQPWFVSLHMMSGVWQVQALLFILTAIFGIMLLFGYKTRLATILSWFLLISLHNRNPMILQGGDIMLRTTLFWAMFLPWGKTYSVDEALARSGGIKEKEEPSPIVFSAASIGFLLQVVFVYIFTVILKSDPIWTKEGSAIYYTLSIDQFTTPVGYLLYQFPGLMTILSFYVYWFEKLGPALVFMPIFTQYLRLLGSFLFIIMHIGMGLALSLGPFPFVAMAAWLAFIPSLFWDKISRLFIRLAKPIIIYYDGDCGFCLKSVHIIKTFFLLSKAELRPASSDAVIFEQMQHHNSWVLVDDSGQSSFSVEAFIVIVRSSPLFFWLSPVVNLAPLKFLGRYLYQLVASHRQRVCLPSLPLPRSFSFPFGRIIVSLFLSFVLFLVFFWNLAGTEYGKWWRPPDYFYRTAYLLRMDQYWNMFSPYPLREDGWYVMPGRLVNGQEVDLFRGGQPVTYEKPQLVSSLYKDARWQKYLMNLLEKRHSSYRGYYSQYLCRHWNKNHQGNETLLSFEIIFMLEYTQLDYKTDPVKPVTLWRQNCF